MKRAHIIILLLYFIFPLIKSEETKWECMKTYYDEVAFPYIINKYEEIFKAGYSGTLLVLSRGNDLAYAEKFSVYASEREDIMPLIRNYNKAWHEKMSHRYEKSADILRELLGSEYFKTHKNNILKYISSCELTYLESYNGRENSELSHVQYFSGIKSEKHADAILDKQDFTFRGLFPNLHRSHFTYTCYCLFEQFHANASNLKEVSQKIDTIDDPIAKKFCAYLFYYFYSIGDKVNIFDGIRLARTIDEVDAYFIIARVIASLDGLMCDYDVWLASNMLYAQAAQKGYLSEVYIFDYLPPMELSEKNEIMQKLWDVWDTYPEQDLKQYSEENK